MVVSIGMLVSLDRLADEIVSAYLVEKDEDASE